MTDTAFNILHNFEKPDKEFIKNKECLMFIVAPFSWRYHEHPIDYWRFSPNGLEYLFNHNNSMKTIIKGWYRPDSLSLYIGQKI